MAGASVDGSGSNLRLFFNLRLPCRSLNKHRMVLGNPPSQPKPLLLRCSYFTSLRQDKRLTLSQSAGGTEDILFDIATNKIYFAQSRPEEEGRSALVSVETGEDIIPRNFDARSRVHECGGAASVVRNGILYFSNMPDNRVYTIRVDGNSPNPKPVTPGTLQLVVDIDRY
jgi:hypothetical protein